MQGMGILDQISDPFWTFSPPQGVASNPLNYTCAPNEATPDYVASYDIRDFVAYGMMMCYRTVHPDYFTMWNMVQKEDVQWLREYFLEILERLVLNIYAGIVEVPTEEVDFDHGQWAESLNIGNGDEGDEDEIMFQWAPGPVHEDALAIVLSCTEMTGSGHGGEDEVIWLAHEAIKDRAAVKAAIEEARKVNNLEPGGRSLEEDWAEVLAKQPTESEE